MQQPKLQEIKNVELYLEGYLIEFLSISIGESDNALPSCQVEVSPTVAASFILPGTKVHVFAELSTGLIRDKQILIFEGEITGIGYNRTPTSESVVFSAYSLLGNYIKTKVRPQDSLITREREIAENTKKVKLNITNRDSGADDTLGPIPSKTSRYDTLQNIITRKQQVTNLTGDLAIVGNLNSIAGLTDEFIRLTSEGKPGSKGDYFKTIQSFIAYFEKNDLYFGIESISYKLLASMIILPNPSSQLAFRTKVAQQGLSQMLVNANPEDLSGAGQLTLFTVLQQILFYIKYKIITPTSPTSVYGFHLDDPKQIPMRAMFLPAGDFGPPINCNIFFPEQVSMVAFSRDMVSEPTRMIAQTYYETPADATPAYLRPIYVMPDLSIQKDSKTSEVDTNFTFEETYRGINFKVIDLDATFALLLKKQIETKESKDKMVDKSASLADSKQQLKNELSYFASENFLNLKYSSRTVQITASWSPYRLVGFPAVIIDPGKPTIVGIVSSINTQISAQGVAQSMITLTKARLIYDEHEFDTDDYLSEYTVDPLSLEGAGSLNSLIYNKGIWGFDTIGEDMYTYITHGTCHINRNIEKASVDFKINLTKDKFKSDDNPNHYESSILKFIKLKTKSTTNPEILVNLRLFSDEDRKILVNENMPTEYKFNLFLTKAISKLKETYDLLLKSNTFAVGNSNTALHDFIDTVTYRNIIVKSEYEDYVGFKFSADIKNTAKDLYSILQAQSINKLKNIFTNSNYYTEAANGKQININSIENSKIDAEINILRGQLNKLNNPTNKAEYLFNNLTKISDLYKTELSKSNIGFNNNFDPIFIKDYINSVIGVTNGASKRAGYLASQSENYRQYTRSTSDSSNSSFTPGVSQVNTDFIAQATLITQRADLLDKVLADFTFKNYSADSLTKKIKELEASKKTDTLNKGIGTLDCIFRPFNITRHAHVYKSFKNIKKSMITNNRSSTLIN